MGGGTVTGVDAWDGMAGRGLDTQGKAARFELRARTQQEAIELYFVQNQCLVDKGADTDVHENTSNTRKCKRMG